MSRLPKNADRDRKRIADPAQRLRVIAAHDGACVRCGVEPWVATERHGGFCSEPVECDDARMAGVCDHDWVPAVRLALELDHIVPWSRGGRTVDENLRPLCVPCHQSRGVLWDR